MESWGNERTLLALKQSYAGPSQCLAKLLIAESLLRRPNLSLAAQTVNDGMGSVTLDDSAEVAFEQVQP